LDIDLDTIGIKENDVHFQSIPQPKLNPVSLASKDAMLADMKRQIGRLFNVPRARSIFPFGCDH
jgi:hypothetical protein